MDFSINVASGLAFALAYVAYTVFHRRSPPDGWNLGLVFCAGISIPVALLAVLAGLRRNINALPDAWPELLTIGGGFALYMACKELWQRFQAARGVKPIKQGHGKGADHQQQGQTPTDG